jgi:hypothetical protein
MPMAVAVLLLGSTAAHAQANAHQCGVWMERYSVAPYRSWGSAPARVREIWTDSDCNHKVCRYMKYKYGVIAYQTYGSLPVDLQAVWATPEVDCNHHQ